MFKKTAFGSVELHYSYFVLLTGLTPEQLSFACTKNRSISSCV